jgi:Putative MetA-pathway of phenol degradation
LPERIVPANIRHQLYFAVALWGWIALGAAAACGQMLEFCDDFGKLGECQRNPWEERIETDRHDFTQSPTTVGHGVVQIEAGYSYFYKDSEGEVESAHTLPEMMLRVGVSEDIELRVRWNYVWQFIDEGADRVGAEDLRYGVKLQITRQSCESWLPTSALELRGTAPTGGEAWSTERAEFGLDYIYQWSLGGGTTLAGSTGYGTDGLADFGVLAEEPYLDQFNELTQSAALGFELSESNTMYVEWFGLFSDGRGDEYVVSVFNLGVDHYVTNNLVIDIRAGVGLSEDADDFFAGAGGGYRF